MQPIIGSWRAIDPETPMGKVVCLRHFEPILDGTFIRLQADWDIGDGKKTYREIAHYGLNRDKVPAFWSFTSDGGQSYGELADVGDIMTGADDLHDDIGIEAKGFEADMPAGLARFAFWPTTTGMIWAAQAKTKHGWQSMIHHVCERID